MSKPVCVTFALNGYEKKSIYTNCINSWKKFHPDIELIVVRDEDIEHQIDFSSTCEFSIVRLEFCKKMFDKGYTKVFMIGLDVFCTSRWDEFINDNDTPLLATLGGCFCLNPDTKLQQVFMPRQNWYENMTIVSDLTCFTKKFVLVDLLEIIKKYKYHDNDAIDIYTNELSPQNCKVVDFPYFIKDFVYGFKSNGLLGSKCVNEDGTIKWGCDGPNIGKFSPSTRWLPIGDKLYNHVGKHVKALFYEYRDTTPDNVNNYYNQETIDWLKEYCDIDLYL